MKALKISKGVLLGLALLLATTALASNKGSLAVADNGPDVQLNIMKGKEVVATVPAHMTELNSASRSDAAVVSHNSDGSMSLSEIRFAGKKYAFTFGGSTQAAMSK